MRPPEVARAPSSEPEKKQGPATVPAPALPENLLALSVQSESKLPVRPSASESTRKQRARVVLIARDGGEGPSYPVGEVTDIGRSEGHIVIADDRYISPRHARLLYKDGTLFLRDLGSVNGIFFRLATAPSPGGSRSVEHMLSDQTLFLVGQQVLRFEAVTDAEEGLGAASEQGTLLFGTPSHPRYGRLVQRSVEGVGRDVYYVRKAETIIGRETGDIVFSDDPFLSRRHAMLRVEGGPGARRFVLSDLGSSNGTFVQRRGDIALVQGDQFRVGQQLFRVDLDAMDSKVPNESRRTNS